jgi:hypothetical protein
VIISYYVSITEFIQLQYTISEEIMVLKSKWNGRTIMQYIPGQPCSSIVHPSSVHANPSQMAQLYSQACMMEGLSIGKHRLVLNYSEQGTNGDLNTVYHFLAC